MDRQGNFRQGPKTSLQIHVNIITRQTTSNKNYKKNNKNKTAYQIKTFQNKNTFRFF
jgi:hypothetical protein